MAKSPTTRDSHSIRFKWTKRAPILPPEQTSSFFSNVSDEEAMDTDNWPVLADVKLKERVRTRKKVNARSSITAEECSEQIERIAHLCETGNQLQALEIIEDLLSRRNDEKFLEMKAQILMQLGQNYDAVKCCEIVVRMNPLWWEGHQTFGRALLAFGEPGLGLKAFQKAVHINPANEELRLELQWVLDHAQGSSVPENADLRNFVQLRKTSCIVYPLNDW